MATTDHTVSLTVEPEDKGTPDKPNPPRIFRLAGMGPKVRAFYVQILKTRAWARLDETALFVNPSRYNRLEACLMRDIAAGKYEWGDEIHESIEGTRAGFTALLLARLKATNPDSSEEDVELLVNKYGFPKLTALMNQADGPPLPNGQSPTPPVGPESTTSN